MIRLQVVTGLEFPPEFSPGWFICLRLCSPLAWEMLFHFLAAGQPRRPQAMCEWTHFLEKVWTSSIPLLQGPLLEFQLENIPSSQRELIQLFPVADYNKVVSSVSPGLAKTHWNLSEKPTFVEVLPIPDTKAPAVSAATQSCLSQSVQLLALHVCVVKITLFEI